MAQKKDDENKYFQIIKLTSKDTPSLVVLLLFIGADAIENEIFYLFAIFFRFLGLLIICGNYNNSSSSYSDHLTISTFFRYFCSYGLTEKLRMSNLVYVVLSIIIFLLLLLMIFLYSRIFHSIKKKKNLENISTYTIQIILQNLFFLLFPYIIEFLSFIFYLQFTNEFIIKKNLSIFINMIIMIINFFSIIGYNFLSYLNILSINSPFDENNDKIKLNYGRNKLIIISLIQNIVMIESLVLYLTNNYLTIYKTALNISILIIFVVFYLYSHYNFNYRTKTSYLINILSIFCFFSIFLEMILYFLGYKIKSYVTLFFYSICKLIIAFCFDYITNIIYENKMINLLSQKLFKIYNDKNISDNLDYNCLYYFNELYYKIKQNSGEANTRNMINIILTHQSKCNNMECKCKYIQIFPYGKKYINEYIKNFLDRINFLVESIFVELDYQKNYELTLLLAEHYYNYKNNPILSYSMIQTILNFNIKALNTYQMVILYTTLTKYASRCNNAFEINSGKSANDIEKEILINKKMKQFKNIFNNYKSLIKIKKVLKKYSTDYLQLIKYKENMEETIQLKKDENNDVIKINSYFLTTKNLSNIMNILLGEIVLNNNLMNYLKKLDTNKVPIDIIYKCALFSELFLCGKIPNEIVTMLYSISSDKNLYCHKIKQNTLASIENIYIKKNLHENSSYYVIFKFINGINIHYFDESLSKKLRYSQKDLLNSSIEKILPKEFRIPHTCAIIRNVINEKNKYINNSDIFVFDREMQMYPANISGICTPGLGKYLYCIIKLSFKLNKNEYYFYLGKNLECISISYNFYQNYHISLNFLNKYKISLLEFIDYKFEDLEVLNKDIIKINKYKENLNMITDYFYSQKLFKEKSKYSSGQNNFHLVTLMKKNENFNSDDILDLNNNNNDEEQINLIEKISNVRYQYKYLKSHLKRIVEKKNRKIFFEKIDELMNRYNNENDLSIKKLMSLSSKFLNNLDSKKEIEIDYGYFNIEYGLTMLYNTYFYIFKMVEVCKDVPLLAQNINDIGSQKKELISVNSVNSYNKKLSKAKIENRLSKDLNGLKNSENKKEKNNSNFLHKVRCFNFVIPLVIILLGLLLIIYVIILLYQRNMVSSSHNGFLIYYYNYFQRDQLYSIYSVLLSSYFHYLNLTNLTDVMSEYNYTELIKRYSTSFQSSFHKFYEVYISNKNHDSFEKNYIFEDLEIYKITNYYNQTKMMDNYIKEAEYIGYITRLIPIDDNLNDIIDDSNKLFLGKIFKEPDGSKTETKTFYTQALYYLSRNYESLYNKVFTYLESEATSEFNQLSSSSKTTYLLIEILGFIIIVLFYIIVLIFLNQTNIAIFRNIINMFINNKKDNFQYKNKKDNYLLIKIISGFVVLINDFNLDNLHKFQFILNQSSNQTLSMDSTLDIKDEMSVSSYDLIDDDKSKKRDSRNKHDILNKMIDSKNNNSELMKLNLSSSKTNLKNNFDNTLKNLNNPQKTYETNITNLTNQSTTKPAIVSTKTLSNKNLVKNKSLYTNKLAKKNSTKQKLSINFQEKDKQKKLKIEDNLNDEEKMTTDMFLKKLVNNGLKDIKVSLIVLFILFIFVVVYVSVKIVISLNFVTEIKGIFEDFGVLSYRYSSMYYYFNSLRTLLVFPDFGNETIFDTMNANMADRLKKMNVVLDFKLNKYPAVGNYYWITGTNMKKPRPSPSYINITCYDDEKCREIINNKKYDVLSEGLKMAVTSMYQQIINIYDDYKKEKYNIREKQTSAFIKEKFINSQYEQIDVNLNYVFICIEYRIYEAFMSDLTALVNKYNSIIGALNICAVIYCFIVAFIVIAFIIFHLKKITKKIEEATLRINNSFSYMLKRNVNIENREDNSSLNNNN